MKQIAKRLFFLSFFFCYLGSALYAIPSLNSKNPQKFYFDTNDIVIEEKMIYVHLGDNWTQTNGIQCDEQGFFVFEENLNLCGSRLGPQKWKCPYCSLWWELGKPCDNKNCPKQQWKRAKVENP